MPKKNESYLINKKRYFMNTVFIENDFLNIKIPKNYIENILKRF